MLFNSYEFMFFLPLVTLIYYVVPRRGKALSLLAASLFFYMCWSAQYVILLGLTTVTTYLAGRFFERNGYRKNASAKAVLWTAMAVNLGLLFFYKYLDFALTNVFAILSRFQVTLRQPELNLVLPVGISFYTFKALSYLLDTYRGKYGCTRNFIHYATYISFFPTLLSGPIDRPNDFIPQLEQPRKFDSDQVRRGMLLMLWGYFLKVVVSDRASQFASVVYGDHGAYSGAFALIATLLYAVQIYTDFYGYSATARGAAQVLGYRINENFRQPYFATSVGEFWRRWHISLSSWLKEYVYIALGGNRCSRIRRYFNIMATFLVSGLWHGASWNYIVWGFLHGFYQIFGDLTKPLRRRCTDALKIDTDTAVHQNFRRLTTCALVTFSWIFFYAGGTRMALSIIRQMLTSFQVWTLFDGTLFDVALSRPEFAVLVISLVVVLIVDILRYRGVNIQGWVERQHILFRWLLYYAVLFSIIIFGVYGSEYAASAFVYFQF